MNRRELFGLLGGVAVVSQLPADDNVYYKGVHIPLEPVDEWPHTSMWADENGMHKFTHTLSYHTPP